MPGQWRDPQSKRRLVFRLRSFQRQTKTKILLVFDGNPDLNFIGPDFQQKKFSVIFPSSGGNADETIKDLIIELSDRRRWFVVSSDREIKSFARRKGIKPLSCREFDRLLKKTFREHRKIRELVKKEPSLSPLEIEQWLERFKGEK